jgi:hypothetical protein
MVLYQNGYNKVVIELRVVQLWSEIKLAITNYRFCNRAFDFRPNCTPLSSIALFHYDVTSKQSIVLTLRIMVARGDKTAAKQIKSQYNLVYDIVESESS